MRIIQRLYPNQFYDPNLAIWFFKTNSKLENEKKLLFGEKNSFTFNVSRLLFTQICAHTEIAFKSHFLERKIICKWLFSPFKMFIWYVLLKDPICKLSFNPIFYDWMQLHSIVSTFTRNQNYSVKDNAFIKSIEIDVVSVSFLLSFHEVVASLLCAICVNVLVSTRRWHFFFQYSKHFVSCSIWNAIVGNAY